MTNNTYSKAMINRAIFTVCLTMITACAGGRTLHDQPQQAHDFILTLVQNYEQSAGGRPNLPQPPDGTISWSRAKLRAYAQRQQPNFIQEFFGQTEDVSYEQVAAGPWDHILGQPLSCDDHGTLYSIRTHKHVRTIYCGEIVIVKDLNKEM